MTDYLAWQWRYGPNLDFLRWLADHGMDVPALDACPQLTAPDALIYQTYLLLAPAHDGPMPIGEILMYCAHAGIDALSDDMIRGIRALGAARDRLRAEAREDKKVKAPHGPPSR